MGACAQPALSPTRRPSGDQQCVSVWILNTEYSVSVQEEDPRPLYRPWAISRWPQVKYRRLISDSKRLMKPTGQGADWLWLSVSLTTSRSSWTWGFYICPLRNINCNGFAYWVHHFFYFWIKIIHCLVMNQPHTVLQYVNFLLYKCSVIPHAYYRYICRIVL